MAPSTVRRAQLASVGALARARASPDEADGSMWLALLDEHGSTTMLRRVGEPLESLDELQMRDLVRTATLLGPAAMAVVVHRPDGRARRVDRRLCGAITARLPVGGPAFVGVVVVGPAARAGPAVCFPRR